MKEWAYAGMVFDLTGAAASHAALGHPAGKVAAPIIITGIVAASWALRPEGRSLRDAAGKPTEMIHPSPLETRLETSIWST